MVEHKYITDQSQPNLLSDQMPHPLQDFGAIDGEVDNGGSAERRVRSSRPRGQPALPAPPHVTDVTLHREFEAVLQD